LPEAADLGERARFSHTVNFSRISYVLSNRNKDQPPMFRSFFPMPKIFFVSALIWALACMAFWQFGGSTLGTFIGLAPTADAAQIGNVTYFWSTDSLWFYIFYSVSSLIFYAFWQWYNPHPWNRWSIAGTMFLIFVTQFSVDTSVALNNWRGTFFDMVQNALTGDTKGKVPAGDLYAGTLDFIEIAFVWIAVAVTNRFFVSHWIFRWRTAMNGFYMDYWKRLRTVEGASQRVQEDTMRFAETMESLFISAVDSILTLLAFLPILYGLSSYITELPLVGKIPAPLVVAAIVWSLFGTVLLVVAGIKLPGLNFKNQRVEAALRKELVYGEDSAARAEPQTVSDLFSAVRKNYFNLYFHYAYFNVFRYFYIQADNVFSLIVMVPTIAAGAMTFGVFQQISSAFSQVSSSFQYLVNSWPTVVELISIYKRLSAFEAVIDDEPLPEIDQKWLDEQSAPIM
jgi:peptide/bleomycin uptake transporter